MGGTGGASVRARARTRPSLSRTRVICRGLGASLNGAGGVRPRGKTRGGRGGVEDDRVKHRKYEAVPWYADTGLVRDTGESGASMGEGEGESLRSRGRSIL